MTDRPIIFSAPMVRALLDGRKTQTRRVLKPQVAGHAYRLATYDPNGAAFFASDDTGTMQKVRLPYATGDRLWVRENWSGNYYWHETPPRDRQSGCWGGEIHIKEDVWYWADGSPEYGDWEKPRPSIHMPRWASRLTLTVTGVRVQRLQDISEADAVAEGVIHDGFGGWRGHEGTIGYPTAIWAYHHLWNSLHGPGAWDANPWVVALTFTVQRGNIDQLPGAK